MTSPGVVYEVSWNRRTNPKSARTTRPELIEIDLLRSNPNASLLKQRLRRAAFDGDEQRRLLCQRGRADFRIGETHLVGPARNSSRIARFFMQA